MSTHRLGYRSRRDEKYDLVWGLGFRVWGLRPQDLETAENKMERRMDNDMEIGGCYKGDVEAK